MPMSPHLAALRAKVGHDLLMAASACVALFDQHGRILLVRLADSGAWGLPGGAIDPNEKPADAAVRECWEESGLLIEPTHLIGVFGGPEFLIQYPNGDRTYYTTIAFGAQLIGGEARPDGLETLEIRYFSREEFDKANIHPPSRLVASQAFLRTEQPSFAKPTWTPGEA